MHECDKTREKGYMFKLRLYYLQRRRRGVRLTNIYNMDVMHLEMVWSGESYIIWLGGGLTFELHILQMYT